MDAKICDRCSVLWKDSYECNVRIRQISIKGELDDIFYYDLCDNCLDGLNEYLRPIKDAENEEKGMV